MVTGKKHISKIILIIVDTLRAKNVGLYGKVPSPTPHIDSLGKQGVVFTHAYTTITKTDPSISAIMSGKYPVSIGLVSQGKDVAEQEEKNTKNITFLSEILRDNGFKTAAIDWMSRWHKIGYQYYSGKMSKDSHSPYLVVDKWPLFFFLRLIDKAFIKILRRDFLLRFYYSFHANPNIPYDPADVVIDKAIDILKENSKNALFLYLHLWDAHAPHTRLKGLKSYFLDDVEKAYNAEITFLDQQVGRLISYLDTAKQRDNTLIILTADHGESLYEHGIPLAHRGLYEEVIKVPLIIRHPLFGSRKISALAQTIDIFPTVLNSLDIAWENTIDGKSLLPLLLNKKGEIRNYAYVEDLTRRTFAIKGHYRKRALLMNNYKFIQTVKSNPKKLFSIVLPEDAQIAREELYNTKKDPWEKHNLVKEKPQIANKLKQKLYITYSSFKKKRLEQNKPLEKKIKKSLSIIRSAAASSKAKSIAIAWTGGKDSTMLVHLVRMAFNDEISFKVIFNDSTMEFEEIYEFIDKISKLWGINVTTIRHSKKELHEFHATKDQEKRKELSRLMKITAINSALKKYKLKAFMVAIRWDEHESRSKEKYFSPRPNHMRIHPILHFTEKDIWEYINYFGVPYVELYDKGYRSLGEKPFTKPVPPGGKERSGREKEKEELMQRLRDMGYW